jgi:hypothetical protein
VSIAVVVYAGFMVAVLPLFGLKASISYELVNAVSMLLIVTGIVWFFSNRSIMRTEDMFQGLKSQDKVGIEEVGLSSQLSTEELLRTMLRRSISVDFIINKKQVDEPILYILEALSESPYSSRIRIVMPVPKERQKSSTGLEFNRRVDLKTLLSSLVRKKSDIVEIKVTSSEITNSVLITDSGVLLFIAFDARKSGGLYLRMEKQSDIGWQHRELFDRLWDDSKPYVAKEE